jgi:hypothetical protein
LLLKSGLPIYNLKIKRQQYAIIEKAVAGAKKKGWMSDDLKLWANAQFIYNGEVYNVKVRIRGDLSPHWKGTKKSWRIKFGKQKILNNGEVQKVPIYFQGKRQINLIIPSDRRYILSYFVNALLRDSGLVVPRDQFVILRINGTIQGLYYEVEHFDKPLLATNHRPETTIFGQNDRAMHFEQYTKYGTPAAADARYDLGSMRRAVDRNGELAMRAMQVLIDHSLNPTPDNFRRVRKVLDWEKYLRFRVLTTLLNTNHVRFGSDNLRLYYDPSRGLLEPVPWDVHLVRLPKEPGTVDFWNSHGPDEIQRATLLDPMLRLQRNKILWKLVWDAGDSLMAKYNAIHERIRPLAWADVLTTPIQGHKMDVVKKDLKYNFRRAYKVLSQSNTNFTYRLDANDKATLEIVALNFSGVQLRRIEISDSLLFEGEYRLYEDANNNGELDRGDPLIQETMAKQGTVDFSFDKYILPGVKYGGDDINGRYWEYFDTIAGRSRFFLVGKLAAAKRHPLIWNPPKIRVAAVNAVTGYQIPSAMISQTDPLPDDYIGITAYDASDPFDLDAPDYSLTQFLQRNPEFTASRDHAGAAELRGKITISGTVIVPKTVPLIVRPGTDITMKPGANILCYGGLSSIGTVEDPIRIHGDGTGEAWGTLAVVRPPEKVVIKYSEFKDGGQAQINGMLFTGGFAVYDGDLELVHSKFTEMQSEDAINLKNGRITMKDGLVANNASDGIDIDFGTGEIKDSQFINNRGDGLDLSGSVVTVSGSWFENMGDKGISVGEDSHPIIVNNFFRNCTIAISTKDLSVAKVAYSTFVDNELAIEAKRKKPIFGAGSGEFVNCVFSGNKKLLQEDYFSKGLVTVTNALVDQPVNWPTSKTTDIRFVAPEQENYVIEPTTVAGNGYTVAKPEWLTMENNGYLPQQPGIFTTIKKQQRLHDLKQLSTGGEN